MTNVEEKTRQGSAFMYDLVIADQMARVNGLHRAARIRKVAKRIRNESIDPVVREAAVFIIKKSDDELIVMIRTMYREIMGESHYDSQNAKENNYVIKEPLRTKQ